MEIFKTSPEELLNTKDDFLIEYYKALKENSERIHPNNNKTCMYQIVEDNVIIGYIGLVDGIDKYGRCELKIRIFDEYMNKEYGTKAVELFTNKMFEDIHIHSIYGYFIDNPAAKQILIKNSFHYNEDESDEYYCYERDVRGLS